VQPVHNPARPRAFVRSSSAVPPHDLPTTCRAGERQQHLTSLSNLAGSEGASLSCCDAHTGQASGPPILRRRRSNRQWRFSPLVLSRSSECTGVWGETCFRTRPGLISPDDGGGRDQPRFLPDSRGKDRKSEGSKNIRKKERTPADKGSRRGVARFCASKEEALAGPAPARAPGFRRLSASFILPGRSRTAAYPPSSARTLCELELAKANTLVPALTKI
jgi:hypothetical protein